MRPRTISTVLSLTFLLGLGFVNPASALCIKSKRANLRTGPSTKSRISWPVILNMPLRKIGAKGKWLNIVDVDGEKHWVFSSLVTSKNKCATIKVKKATLRSGPGTQYPAIKKQPTAEKYTCFQLVKIKGKWAQLKDEFGQKLWVFRDLIWVQ